MECTFESLPFLFPERERPFLQRWRDLAIEKERQISQRRADQLRELQKYVATRLSQLEARELPRSSERASQSSAVSSLHPPPLTAVSSSSSSSSIPHSLPSTQPHILTSTNAKTAVLIPHSTLLPSHSTPLPPHCSPSQYSHGPLHNAAPISLPPPQIPPRGRPAPRTEGAVFTHTSVNVSDKGVQRRRNIPRPPPPGDVYVRLTALGRGFLTRRLLQSEKVKSLKGTIKDARAVLNSLSDPSSSSSSSPQDLALRERVQTQLQVAQMTFHDILSLPIPERMAYIAHSRVVREERRRRKREEEVATHPSHSRGRLSLATQKSIERRQKSATSHIPLPQARKPPVKLVKPAPVSSKAKPEQDKPVGQDPKRARPVMPAVVRNRARALPPRSGQGRTQLAAGPASLRGSEQLGKPQRRGKTVSRQVTSGLPVSQRSRGRPAASRSSMRSRTQPQHT